MLGIIAAKAYYFGNNDIITVMFNDPTSFFITKLAINLFPISNLISGIPIFSIIIR